MSHAPRLNASTKIIALSVQPCSDGRIGDQNNDAIWDGLSQKGHMRQPVFNGLRYLPQIYSDETRMGNCHRIFETIYMSEKFWKNSPGISFGFCFIAGIVFLTGGNSLMFGLGSLSFGIAFYVGPMLALSFERRDSESDKE
ncbi:MAG TPA: hypothetical protein VF988_09110 [Verrucomicrobiae bacterium]